MKQYTILFEDKCQEVIYASTDDEAIKCGIERAKHRNTKLLWVMDNVIKEIIK